MASLDPVRRGVPEEERLPWLDEVGGGRPPRRRGPGRWLLVAALLVALAGMGAWWWRGHHAELAGGAPGLIQAAKGPYKVRPPEAGGMEVEGEGFASFAASEGEEPRGAINLSAVPEAPMAKPKADAPAPAAAEPPPSAPVASTGGAAVQLGAFSSEAKARAAWKGLSGRFGFLAAREPVIVAARAEGGATVYRLRTVAGDPRVAARICGRLRVAGEACQPVTP